MERKKFIQAAFMVSLMPALLLTACKEGDKKEAAANIQTYTCSMHPQIVQDKPGACPICGMDLVPFDKNKEDLSLTLGESQMGLANITVITAGTGILSNNKLLNGRLATDPAQSAVISSRVPGRIETLYVKETGVAIKKGQALYRIYSEQLATLQQEYLLAAAQAREFPDDARFQQIGKAARQKLKLYDQSDAQLEQLLQSTKTDPFITYYAPMAGVVAELSVSEGQYVSEGNSIMKLEGYGQLWVEADLYPAEISAIHVGQSVKVIVAGYENEPRNMTIQFINPALQTGSQLMQVRGTIPNQHDRWQPGQQATIYLPVQSKGNVISVPVDAVIRDGNGSHVWIETDKGKFKPRMVKTGLENFDMVEIREGIEAGEKVVATGAYLLYSEYILKKGSNPMAGHQHS